MSQQTELTFTQQIEVNPSDVYYALTHALGLTEWLCHYARLDVRIGGHIHLAWNQGYHANGEFTDLEPDQLVAFTWHGRGETAVTQVNITLTANNTGTAVTITHTGLGAGDEWAETRTEFKQGWQNSLENLKSVLETGIDKRIYDQPLLGIIPAGVVTAEQGAAFDPPIAGGIRLSGTVPQTGAAAIGLQADDILTQISGFPVTDYPSLTMAIAPYRAGEQVTVTFYRDDNKQTAQMMLAHRPIPNMPETPHDLAIALRRMYDELAVELGALLADVTDEMADQSPATGEWSIKQIIAHLRKAEQLLQMILMIQLEGNIADGLPGNVPAMLQATTAVYPTLSDLILAWKRACAETVALIVALPDDIIRRKATYLNMGSTLLIGFPAHTRSHFREIERLLNP